MAATATDASIDGSAEDSISRELRHALTALAAAGHSNARLDCFERACTLWRSSPRWNEDSETPWQQFDGIVGQAALRGLNDDIVEWVREDHRERPAKKKPSKRAPGSDTLSRLRRVEKLAWNLRPLDIYRDIHRQACVNVGFLRALAKEGIKAQPIAWPVFARACRAAASARTAGRDLQRPFSSTDVQSACNALLRNQPDSVLPKTPEKLDTPHNSTELDDPTDLHDEPGLPSNITISRGNQHQRQKRKLSTIIEESERSPEQGRLAPGRISGALDGQHQLHSLVQHQLHSLGQHQLHSLGQTGPGKITAAPDTYESDDGDVAFEDDDSSMQMNGAASGNEIVIYDRIDALDVSISSTESTMNPVAGRDAATEVSDHETSTWNLPEGESPYSSSDDDTDELSSSDAHDEDEYSFVSRQDDEEKDDGVGAALSRPFPTPPAGGRSESLGETLVPIPPPGSTTSTKAGNALRPCTPLNTPFSRTIDTAHAAPHVSNAPKTLTSITDGMIQSLEPGQWLSASAVAACILCFNPDPDRYRVFESGFLNLDEPQQCRDRARGRSVPQPVRIFPICINNNHFVLGIVSLTDHTLEVFDPLAQSHPTDKTHTGIGHYASGLSATTTWTWKAAPSLKQPNNYDCGVYVAVRAIMYMHGRDCPLTLTGEAWRRAFILHLGDSNDCKASDTIITTLRQALGNVVQLSPKAPADHYAEASASHSFGQQLKHLAAETQLILDLYRNRYSPATAQAMIDYYQKMKRELSADLPRHIRARLQDKADAQMQQEQKNLDKMHRRDRDAIVIEALEADITIYRQRAETAQREADTIAARKTEELKHEMEEYTRKIKGLGQAVEYGARFGSKM